MICQICKRQGLPNTAGSNLFDLKRRKKIKILSQGVAQPKSKQAILKIWSGGEYGRTLQISNVDELIMLGDQMPRGGRRNT